MKITNDAGITPEEAARRDALLTVNDKTPGEKKARTARRVKISPSKKYKPAGANDITAAVGILIERLGTPPGHPDFARKVRAEKAAINSGFWNPAYWLKCDIDSTVFLGSAPSNVPDNDPPPYAYRDSNNLPTTATYGAGSANNAPARYSGATSGDRFTDTLLVWSRTVYILEQPVTGFNNEPVIVDFQGTLTVAGNMRGSRPMLSIVLRCYLTNATGNALTTTANPVAKLPPSSPPNARGCNSLYWRYKIPNSAPPFFNTIKPRKILRNLPEISTIDAEGDLTRAVICCAPRPMLGRGFNNNSSITSSLSGIPDIYQIPESLDFHIFFRLHMNIPPELNGNQVIHLTKKVSLDITHSEIHTIIDTVPPRQEWRIEIKIKLIFPLCELVIVSASQTIIYTSADGYKLSAHGFFVDGYLRCSALEQTIIYDKATFNYSNKSLGDIVPVAWDHYKKTIGFPEKNLGSVQNPAFWPVWWLKKYSLQYAAGYWGGF